MANSGFQLEDFTNPNSMITPGAAGAVTMVITNVLTSQFDGLPANWTALILSFVFGALTFVYSAKIIARAAYFIINSLIIFVMAHGSNGIGVAVTHTADAAPAAIHAVSAPANLPGGPGLTLASFLDERPAGKARDFSRGGHLILVQANTNTSKDKSFFKTWSWTGK